MSIGVKILIAIVLVIRAACIGSESTSNIMQQQLQTIQWLGFGMMVIIVLLADIALKLKNKES